MAVVRNLMVRGGADFSGMQRGMANAQRSLNQFQNSVSKSMNAIKNVLITIGIGKVIKDSVQSAVEFESAVNQINRILGASADEFKSWADTQSTAMGMAKVDAMKYGAVYGNLISGFAKDNKETMQYTEQLLKASSVVASATGRTMEDTMERIRSGLLGNTESIEDLGINVNIAMIQSTKAFQMFANGKSWNQLNFQTQQQIRLMAILEQANSKYGNTLANTTATQLMMFRAALRNVQTSLGQAFIPIVKIVLPALTALAQKLAYLLNIIAQFTQALFGKSAQEQSAKATSGQSSAVGDLGKAYDKTGKSAKKAQQSLAGFDQLNTLNKKTDSEKDSENVPGIASGGAASLGNIGFDTNAPEISEKVQAMADRVKSVVKNIADTIKSHKEVIIAAIAGIGTALLTVKFAEWGTAAVLAVGKVIKIFKDLIVIAKLEGVGVALTTLISPIGLVAAAVGAVTAAFVYLYQTNDKFKGLIDGALLQIKNVAVDLWNNALVPFGTFMKDTFTPVFVGLKNALKPIGSIVKDVLNIAFGTLKEILDPLFNLILKPIGDLLATTFKGALAAIAEILKTSVIPKFQGFTDTLKKLWDNVLKPIALFISDGFVRAFKTAAEAIGGKDGVITGLKNVFNGLLQFITGVFTGNWKKAFEGLKNIVTGIFKSVSAVIKGAINIIIDGINFMIRGINKLKIPKIEIFGKEFGGFGVNIGEIPKLAKGGITNGPTLAMIGDNPGGVEVVQPLSELEKMIEKTVNASISAVEKDGQTGGNQTIIVKIGDTEFGRYVINTINNTQRQAGKTLLEV